MKHLILCLSFQTLLMPAVRGAVQDVTDSGIVRLQFPLAGHIPALISHHWPFFQCSKDMKYVSASSVMLNPLTGELLTPMRQHLKQGFFSARGSPRNMLMLPSSTQVVDFASGKVLLNIPGMNHLWTSVWGKPLHEVPIVVAAVPARNGVVEVWNLDLLTRVLEIRDNALWADINGPLQQREWFTASQSGTILAWLTPEGEVHVWDLRTRVGRRSVLGTIGKKRDPSMHHALQVSPDGRQVAVVEHKVQPNELPALKPILIEVAIHHFRIADRSHKELHIQVYRNQFQYPDGFSMFFAPSGNELVVFGGRPNVSVFDVDTGRRVRSYVPFVSRKDSPNGRYRDLILSKDVFALVSMNHCRFRPVKGIDDYPKMTGWYRPRYDAISPDGFYCFGEFSDDGTIREIATGEEIVIADQIGLKIFPRWYSPDGKYLITSGNKDRTHSTSEESIWHLSELSPSMKLPSQKPLSQWIADLESPDPTAGQIAIRRLALQGDTIIEPMMARVRQKDMGDKILALITNLDDADYAVREQATNSLTKLGQLAKESLERALKEAKSAEVRARSKRILAVMNVGRIPPEEIAQLRAVQVLGIIGSDVSIEELRRFDKDAINDRVRAANRLTLFRSCFFE